MIMKTDAEDFVPEIRPPDAAAMRVTYPARLA
jgi:hypothetical protein